MKPTRSIAYGQTRQFKGLERFAIQRRQRIAQQAMQTLVEARSRQDLDVLELGCGYAGANLQLLAEAFPQAHYTGVDLRVAKDVVGDSPLRLLEADVESWKPKQSYDLVISLAVVEHLVRSAAHFALIAASLTSNGLAVLTTPTPIADLPLRALARLGIFDRDEIADHKTYLTHTGIQIFCKEAGLEIVDYHLASFGMNHAALLRKGAPA